MIFNDNDEKAFKIYKNYLALSRHFKDENYDFIKYKGKVRGSEKSFTERKDKIFFYAFLKYQSPFDFLLSNFVYEDSPYLNEFKETNYLRFVKRTGALTYHFQNQIQILSKAFYTNFKVNASEHPEVLKLFLGDEISIETLCILNDILKFSSYWDSMLEKDLIWKPISFKMRKYQPFLKYDRSKLKKIMVEYFDKPTST